MLSFHKFPTCSSAGERSEALICNACTPERRPFPFLTLEIEVKGVRGERKRGGEALRFLISALYFVILEGVFQ